MKECPNCGVQVRDEWSLCPSCRMNIRQAADLLGRDYYAPPASDPEVLNQAPPLQPHEPVPPMPSPAAPLPPEPAPSPSSNKDMVYIPPVSQSDSYRGSKNSLGLGYRNQMFLGGGIAFLAFIRQMMVGWSDLYTIAIGFGIAMCLAAWWKNRQDVK